jgi:hypothetical protein
MLGLTQAIEQLRAVVPVLMGGAIVLAVLVVGAYAILEYTTRR